jgi:hypothetical protein
MEAAFESSPNAVGIISWNEFSENSHIEPSCEYGDQDLKVVAAMLGGTAPSGLPKCVNGVPVGVVPAAKAVPEPILEDAGQTDPAPNRASRPSKTTLTIDQQIRSDFDSSSPGATHGGFGGIAVLLLLAAFIVFNLVIVIRRSRGRSLPPPETLHQVH